MKRHSTTQYHRTAGQRSKPSSPSRWLYNNTDIQGPVLDYGCGRGADVNHFKIDGYDPNGPDYQHLPHRYYRTILCTYVLNVIPTSYEREEVIKQVKSLLTEDGVAYFSVRADKSKLQGWTTTGTYQTFVELDYPIIHRTSGYIIYKVEETNYAAL
tara:strand:+ start:147 stop:614 length:468 start_codon:yes stop_codon:yes gene_type:complete